ncbi:MAG: hypothetical protein IJP81_10055 [Bacteroidales bacterium]|nr:hypothetical protein [Bacteroidales bacterium]
MRQLFIAVAAATAALALASCDPRELVVTDNSALKSITLQVNNDNPKWEFGEERIFTIKVTPATAICDRFELTVSNLDIVVIRDGELPNQFKVTANGEGKIIVTGIAVGHDENGVAECTATEEYTLEDHRVKPTRPVVEATVAPGSDLNAKKVLAEDVSFVTDTGLELVLNVGSDESRATYSLKAEDSKVLSIERTGSESWMLRTVKPGRTWLTITVTDGLGNPFEYRYLVYVFGHLDMETQYCPLDGSAGFSVSEHNFTGLTAQVYIAGELFGWPWNDANNIESISLPTYTGTLDISETFEYLELLDCSEQQDYLYSLSTGPSYNPAPFTPHKAKLNYIVTLSDPYIIIDQLIDDTNLDEPRWWNFWTEGALQQNGIAKVVQPDELVPITFNPGVDGWEDGNEYSIPL